MKRVQENINERHYGEIVGSFKANEGILKFITKTPGNVIVSKTSNQVTAKADMIVARLQS